MLTPEDLAELRRLLDDGSTRPWVAFRANDPNPGGRGWVGVTRDIDVDYDPDIFASQRCAPRDAVLIAAAINALPALLDAAAERDALAADCDALRAMLAGRCLSDITHRDEGHRQSVCMLPAEHAPLAHDDCMGCTWTDAEHWEPSAVDRVVDEVARIADESQHEDWDSPRVRSIVGRIRRAIDGAES